MVGKCFVRPGWLEECDRYPRRNGDDRHAIGPVGVLLGVDPPTVGATSQWHLVEELCASCSEHRKPTCVVTRQLDRLLILQPYLFYVSCPVIIDASIVAQEAAHDAAGIGDVGRRV